MRCEQPIRILLIEDRSAMLQSLLHVFARARQHKEPYHVVSVETSSEAQVRARSESFDAVLLDLRCKDRPGLEAVSELRRELGTMPIVALANSGDLEGVRAALRSGADDVLFDSAFDPRWLTDSIDRAIERKHCQNDHMELKDALLRVGENLTRQTDIECVMQSAAEQATSLLRADYGAWVCETMDETGGRAHWVAASAGPRASAFVHGITRLSQRTRTQGLENASEKSTVFDGTFDEQRVVRIDDLASGDSLGPIDEGSYLAVPVVSRHRYVLGALVFGHANPDHFDDHEELLARGIAAWAAIAADNARLLCERQGAIAAREDILAVVSHDLRTPLQVVEMATTLIDQVAPATLPHLRSKIDKAVAQARRLIDDLIDAAAVETGALRVEQSRNDLTQSVRTACASVYGMAVDAGIYLDCFVHDSLPPLWIDPDRIQQAISNLLSNAIRYSPRGATVTVHVRKDEGGVRVSVRDRGSGIAAADLPHLFDRFYRGASAKTPGAGLGLAITKGIIEAHGGRIWASSEPGQGATLAFVLPLATRDIVGRFLR